MVRLFPETLEQRFAYAAARLESLVEQVSNGSSRAVSLREVRVALEALPLSMDAAATARNRLENARCYLQDGERGAARYELALVMRSLAAE